MIKKRLSKTKNQEKLAKRVGDAVKPQLVAKGLQDMMPKLLMYMMHQQIGMSVAAKTVFYKDTYVVVEFQVKHVDSTALCDKIQEGLPDPDEMEIEVTPKELDAWMKEQEAAETEAPPEPPAEGEAPEAEESSEGFTWSGWIAQQTDYVISNVLPDSYKESLENDTMPSVVQSKITEMMGAIMERKLDQKHLDAEIAVLSAADQARYFYTNLEVVEERKA